MDLHAEALDRFQRLLAEAEKTDLREPTAMTLATADSSGQPSARTVLLKSFDERGFVFFTNIKSRKGQQLAGNRRAALCFFWHPLMQQVTIEGTVMLISDEEAETYWQTRPRDSQLSAWASKQSEPLDNPDTMVARVAQFNERYKDQLVPRPPHWSGYRVVPQRIEFWKAGWHRLHDRICYYKSGESWDVALLYP